MLLGLAMDFCEAINSSDIPKIENSVGRVLQEETRVIHDDCYAELQQTLDEEISIEDPLKKEQLDAIIYEAKSRAIMDLELRLSRFLEFDEILLETKKFKTRLQPLIKSKEEQNYTQGFHQSRQYLDLLLSENSNNLKIKSNGKNLENPSQMDNINMVFKSFQDIIKKYRGKSGEDESDNSEESEEEEVRFASAAHYDVLAESITKLVSVRPTEYTQDRKFGKQEMIDSVQFVDYD